MIDMNDYEVVEDRTVDAAELEVAKAATNRDAIVEFGYYHPNFKSVYYKTGAGEPTVIYFNHAHNALQFYRWIDAYFADQNQ